MSAGILELMLVFGVVLALAVFDLLATKRTISTDGPSPKAPSEPASGKAAPTRSGRKPQAKKGKKRTA